MQFFLENILLFAIAFISGAMLLWPLLRARAAGPSVNTLEATRLINSKNAQIVDVRTPQEFATGSLPHAKNIPAANLKERLGELKKERPVIVVCDTGTRAGPAAAQLRAGGFAEVYVLTGGVRAWREAGLPLRKQA
ncbi:MAG: rhodanese-like domain-containing protein [Sutterellaceae bacterium]|nr:rhodanese-like domain-containing protein [Burkholderiaceae bacterium]MCX7901268.1 rhodanese-like domain-containing protein [Burkholderiaceae bacterium]MDW8429411.1 rhodanese-like domain-containing protein [Sutterellaceae bacterium]